MQMNAGYFCLLQSQSYCWTMQRHSNCVSQHGVKLHTVLAISTGQLNCVQHVHVEQQVCKRDWRAFIHILIFKMCGLKCFGVQVAKGKKSRGLMTEKSFFLTILAYNSNLNNI